MKNRYLLLLLSLCVIALAFNTCTLDKEPDIPTGATNKKIPVFDTAATEVVPNASNNFQAKTRLSSLGNLNILQHGWVWGKVPGANLLDTNLYKSNALGGLTIASFAKEITGLDLGTPYYVAPYVITGSDTIYGPEKCAFVGVNFTINTDTIIFKGADVTFTNTSVGSNTYTWDFGDGHTSTDNSPPPHTFNTLGNITVRLTAKNGGCLVQKEMMLQVISDPFEGYWVQIAAGTFSMGCTPEQQPGCEMQENPVHQVTLSAFFIGKTEITQGQWLAVTGNNPSFDYKCGADCPVESISWERIVDEFIPMLYRKTGRTYRLPTEAEWEYAARGGSKASSMTRYSGSNVLDSVGWYNGNSDKRLHGVMGKKQNALGLYDMTGNVSEWCADWYDEKYYQTSPSIDPAGPSSPTKDHGRCLRGGSWLFSESYCPVADRNDELPNERSKGFGFRLAR